MRPRYALYVAPEPGTALWRFGGAVLGYDAGTGREVPFPSGPPFERPDWPDLVAEPRRYGFHATLKAPFHLAEGVGEADLLAALRDFTAARAALAVPALAVVLVGPLPARFVALVPAAPSPDLDALAAACVRHFDRFRAPLSEADRARRRAAPLSERQVGHLARWGYPHVLADFRFHLTLTGALPPDLAEPVRAALAARYAALAPGLPIDGIAVFRQEDREGRFRIRERVRFGG